MIIRGLVHIDALSSVHVFMRFKESAAISIASSEFCYACFDVDLPWLWLGEPEFPSPISSGILEIARVPLAFGFHWSAMKIG